MDATDFKDIGTPPPRTHGCVSGIRFSGHPGKASRRAPLSSKSRRSERARAARQYCALVSRTRANDQSVIIRAVPRRPSRNRLSQCAKFALLFCSLWLISCHTAGGIDRAEAGSGSGAVGKTVVGPPAALRLTGTTAAAHSFVVMAPQLEGAQIGNMLITEIVRAGTRVETGQVLVRFDPQSQMKDYLEKKDKFAELAGQVAQKQAEEDIARAKDETSLREAENAQKKAQLEVQKNELVSKIDAEKNEEALEEARMTSKQLHETFQLKRKSATAGIRILELQRDRAREAMRYAESNAAKMTVKSPMNGIVVLNTIWLGGRMGTVQPGDQVNPGTSFMQVVDPSTMEVRVQIPQPDLGQVHVGDRAQVHPDAYPQMVLPAVLEEVSPLGQEGNFSDKIRVFTARFVVHGNDPKLLPDLSVAVDLEPPARGPGGSGRPRDP
jgi:HlyD family secretion protein